MILFPRCRQGEVFMFPLSFNEGSRALPFAKYGNLKLRGPFQEVVSILLPGLDVDCYQDYGIVVLLEAKSP